MSQVGKCHRLANVLVGKYPVGKYLVGKSHGDQMTGGKGPGGKMLAGKWVFTLFFCSNAQPCAQRAQRRFAP